MKRLMKFFSITLLLFVIIFITSPVKTKADIGPKPSLTVKVTGANAKKYTITFIGTRARGPNITYEQWREHQKDDYHLGDYHPIMEYVDSEGYMWVGHHQTLEGDGEFTWGYYPPRDFKILILTEDGKFYSSKALSAYAFNSYYKIDFNKLSFDEAKNIGQINFVKNNYNYGLEIISFLIRLSLTIGIELALALLFRYRSKRHLVIILITNAITQLFLNIGLNLVTYFQGILLALIFYTVAEIFITLTESIFYATMFKKEGSFKAFMYGVVANVLSFGVGIGLFALTEALKKL